MSDKTPLVRSEQLAPLSRDHYEGLSFVWKIRQGLKKNVSLQTVNDFIRWFWQTHLQSHFEDEEKILLPHLPVNDQNGRKMQLEHDDMRHLIEASKIMTASEINFFADLLYNHIRFEERELFPYIEKKLSQTELNEILKGLGHEHTCSTEWKNEFWKS
jgi:hemerythrin-like domain-containing protein